MKLTYTPESMKIELRMVLIHPNPSITPRSMHYSLVKPGVLATNHKDKIYMHYMKKHFLATYPFKNCS